MREASEVLAEARLLTANGQIEGAIRLLRDELDKFSGLLEERRSMVALLLTYCGKREKLSEGVQIAEEHFERDPVSVIDSSLKARLVMNYAALKAASGNTTEAIVILGNILLSARSSNVSDDDVARITAMLESLKIAEDRSSIGRSGLSATSGSRSQAYLASAHISRMIESGSFPEAVSLARATLGENADLEDGPLKVALTLDLGVALAGEGKADEAGECLARSYDIGTWSLMRSGTLFGLVARSYAAWLSEAGQLRRSVNILEDLLEAQLLRFGDDSTEVEATKALLSRVRSVGG